MSDLVTDEMVKAAWEAAGECFDGTRPGYVADEVLRAVAPLIVAKALRDFAASLDSTLTMGRVADQGAALLERSAIVGALHDKALKIEGAK